MSVRVVTANVNQFIQQRGWDMMIPNLQKQGEVLLLQETKNTYLKGFKGNGWNVFHVTDNDATANSAVMWHDSAGELVNSGIHLLTTPMGVRMETRYIAWVDLLKNGKVTRYGSVHYPPKRYAHLWVRSYASTRAWIIRARRKGRAFVLGGDFNSNVRRNPVAKSLRLITRRAGIDGFIVSRRLGASRIEDLGDNRSDHNPYRIKVWRKLRRRKK